MAKHLKRRLKPYTSTRIKARNFLSNIADAGVKNEDFVGNNFVFDIITLLTKNVNPFSLERKITDPKNRDIIYMFWEECTEKTFYKNENFMYLNGKNVLYVKRAQIVMNYLDKDQTNIIRLRRCLQKNMKTVQFVYLRCFLKIYSLIDKHGIDIKGEFVLAFKVWKDKKSFPLKNNKIVTQRL